MRTDRHSVVASQNVQKSVTAGANLFEAYAWAVETDCGTVKLDHWLKSLFMPLADAVYQDLGGRHKYREKKRDTPGRK